jgi:aldose 1-epimerase
MKVSEAKFGQTKTGEDIILYTLENSKGMKATVMNYGAILVDLLVPDKAGNVADVVLGFDKPEDYFGNPSFFGALIGPCGNRIADATFEIDGETYQLDVNDGKNNLHSHIDLGYHKRMWDAEVLSDGVAFSLKDEDGSMGFPGNKSFKVVYTLDEDNALTLTYDAASDKKTIINPTNHSYFNLDGHDSGKILGHKLRLAASRYTEVVEGAIPTGELPPVAGTPMDFTVSKEIGLEIDADMEQLTLVQGYDHNWVIDDYDGTLRLVGTLEGAASGRKMEVYTDLPGIQFYAGNCIAPQAGKKGANYDVRSGLCLETQFFPDSIHQPSFPSSVFGPDKAYHSKTIYKFV